MTKLALIKLTRPETSSDTEALLSRWNGSSGVLASPIRFQPAQVSSARSPPDDTACACRGGAGVPPSSSLGWERQRRSGISAGRHRTPGPRRLLRAAAEGVAGPFRVFAGRARCQALGLLQGGRACTVEATSSSSKCPTDFICSHCKRTTRSRQSWPPGRGPSWWPGASEVRAEGGRRRRLRGSDHRHVPARGAARGVD